MTETSALILSLLAGIQKEKGLAILATMTLQSADQDKLQAQIARNEALLSQIHGSNIPSLSLQPETLLQTFAHRPYVADGLTGWQTLLDWYTHKLEYPLHQATRNLMINWFGLGPAQTSAALHLLAGLQDLGQIRDKGLISYAAGDAGSQTIQQLKELALCFLGRERLFLNHADAALRIVWDDQKAAAPELYAAFEIFIRKLKDGYAKGLFAQTSLHDWFQTIDDVQAGLYAALVQTLIRIAKDEAENPIRIAAGGITLELDIENQLDSIAALPLFRGVADSALRASLNGARILHLDKNTTFLTQGEPVSRLYVIMDGWVKTFKSSAEGEEAILQIIGKRDCLLDHGNLTGGAATFSARTITRTKVLALALPSLREQVARHHDLSQNLLAATSGRLQKLVAQYEQITLRTAVQRVGWFLVNLHLETGLEGAPLELPYDKSLIAAYLNIKPETFSRVLQHFRKEGFKIDKHRVTLPHPQALCGYCDPDLAMRCCRAEAVQCAPIRVARRSEAK